MTRREHNRQTSSSSSGQRQGSVEGIPRATSWPLPNRWQAAKIQARMGCRSRSTKAQPSLGQRCPPSVPNFLSSRNILPKLSGNSQISKAPSRFVGDVTLIQCRHFIPCRHPCQLIGSGTTISTPSWGVVNIRTLQGHYLRVFHLRQI